MLLNIIFDDRYPEDYERLLIEFEKNKIVNYKFWAAVVEKDSVVKSINKSHKEIIRFAKNTNEEEVIIAEQDVFFTSPESWNRFIDLKPKEYDLYLGGAYGLNKTAWNRVRKEDGIVEVHNFVGLHCYFCHSRYYDKFLSVPDDQHIDTIQAGLGKFYLCYPMIAIQRPGFSANNMNVVNYNSDLEPEDIYQ